MWHIENGVVLDKESVESVQWLVRMMAHVFLSW